MATKKFDNAFDHAATNHAKHSQGIAFLQNAIFPLAIAVLGICSPWIWALDKRFAIGAWLFVAVSYGLTWWKAHPAYSDLFDLLNQKRKDEIEIERLKSSVSELESHSFNLYIKNMAAFVLRHMSVEYVKAARVSKPTRVEFDEMISELLSPLYLSGDTLLGFNISEKWNLSLYLCDEKSSLLKPVWREKAATHPSDDLGRNWRVGEGHVGKAFLDRRPILTGDANEASVAQLCRARDSLRRDYDDEIYVSFASVPVSMSDGDEVNPHGVLVATSNIKDRFLDEQTTELLKHFSDSIAVIMDLADLDIGCIVNESQDKQGVIAGGEKAESNEKG